MTNQEKLLRAKTYLQQRGINAVSRSSAFKYTPSYATNLRSTMKRAFNHTKEQ